jgi:hypothetical protein
MKLFLALAAAVFWAWPALAAPLISFDANIALITNATIPTQVQADIIAPAFGSGVTLTRNSGLTGLAFNARFGSASFSTAGEGGSLAAGDYLTFTLTPTGTFDFSGYSLSLVTQTAGAGPQSLGIYTSVGGFAVGDALQTITLQRTGTPQAAVTVDLSSLGSVSGPVEIRFYGYGATNASGAMSINSLSVVPEPATAGSVILGGLLMAGSLAHRRQRATN